MLTRILALPVVLLLAPSTLAPAHAHALSLESASPGIFAGNVDLLKEIPDLTHCCIKEKSTERSESSNRREEYLRARYMDPAQGRFLGMDPWAGNADEPISLHRTIYANLLPANLTDPSGMAPYTRSFGNEVHDYVCEEYRHFEPGHVVDCDTRLHFGFLGDYFKPDIIDRTRRIYGEVKPLSPSGITSGVIRIERYDMAFGTQGWMRLWGWFPRQTVIQDAEVFFFNIDGIVFYTDDEDERNALRGQSLEGLKRAYDRFQRSRNGQSRSSPMGIDAVAVRAVLRGAGIVARAGGYQIARTAVISPLLRF